MRNINTIVLKGGNHHEEHKAGSNDIRPGMSVTIDADNRCRPAEDTSQGMYFAKEDALQGRTIDDLYLPEDIVFLYRPNEGDHIHILVASGQTVNVGDLGTILEGKGVVEDTPDFQYLEASDGALTKDTHLKARILGSN